MNGYVCLLKDAISEENWTLKIWISLQVEKSFLCLFGIDDASSAVQWKLLFASV